jgi:hypothetical protein
MEGTRTLDFETPFWETFEFVKHAEWNVCVENVRAGVARVFFTDKEGQPVSPPSGCYLETWDDQGSRYRQLSPPRACFYVMFMKPYKLVLGNEVLMAFEPARQHRVTMGGGLEL